METIEAILNNQEPLGQEFEEVLYDNLWELYQETLCYTN